MNIIQSDAIPFLAGLKEKPRLILTDPPYGMNYKTNIPGDKRWNKSGLAKQKFEVLANDKSLDTIDFDAFFKLCFECSADDSFLFCFCNDKAMVEWSSAAVNAGYEWKDTLVWNKRCANGGDISWPFITVKEMILAFKKGSPTCYPLFNKEMQLKKRVVNVFDCGRTPKAEHIGHPTQKPVFICEQLIRATTIKGECVVDPFCGSGTSLVAAKKMGRLFRGCDIDHAFVTLAQSRIDETDVNDAGIFQDDDD